MSLTIAIPDNPNYAALTANAHSLCQERGYVCTVMTEKECGESLYKGVADIALIDPLSFARTRAELRIIPSLALSVTDFSNMASVHFIPGKEDIKVLALQEDAYLLRMGALCLSEKFDLFPDVIIDSSMNACDAFIAWNSSKGQGSLDIGEEWTDIQQVQLPLLFWATKDEESMDLLEITRLCAVDDLPSSEEVISSNDGTEADARIGTIHYDYSGAFQSSLDAVQHFLFYHRMIESVRAITLLGQ